MEKSTEIGFKTVVKMVQNFIDNTFKGTKKLTHDKDSHAVHYTKADIDALFAANGFVEGSSNPSDFGLRIYLGFHTDSLIEKEAMPTRPANYIGQHTVILVATKDGKNLLNPGDFVPMPKMQPGTAVEEGQICPPPSCDDEISALLHS